MKNEDSTLSDLGEDGLIQVIKNRFSQFNPSYIYGIGDDCAIFTDKSAKTRTYSTDMLIEDVHFKLDKISAEDLGYKSMMVSISDIASSGAKLEAAFLSLALPSQTKLSWISGFFKGIESVCKKHKISLAGGDTTASPGPIIINLLLTGLIPKGVKPKLRSKASVDDVICVSGALGSSAAGLKLLLRQNEFSPLEQSLINMHLRPVARIKEGVWLSKQNSVTAMMDISDGLSTDLKRLTKASNTSFEVELDKIPTTSNFVKICKKEKWNQYELAYIGGEDYELLFTVKPSKLNNICKAYEKEFGKKIFQIGKIRSVSEKDSLLLMKKEVYIESKGYKHF